MDARNDIREFLVSRRARITPEQAGLPAYGRNRRVKGLRREEVALLAGISAEYYIRVERGSLRGVSEDVLDGIARALQLDEAERLHLRDLAAAANASPGRRPTRRSSQDRIRPVIQRLLDSFVGVPAFVTNERLDVIAANQLGEAFYAPLYDDPIRPVNTARFVFLNPRARDFYGNWNKGADDTVAVLRTQAARDAHDKRLSDLIGELSTRSDDFRGRWARHDVKLHNTGTKDFHHPVVGDLTLDWDMLQLPGDPGQQMLTYSAEPGSPSHHAIQLLASWASTPAATDSPASTPSDERTG
jgi:transcriptional regulator with XRE-family HTH domain